MFAAAFDELRRESAGRVCSEDKRGVSGEKEGAKGVPRKVAEWRRQLGMGMEGRRDGGNRLWACLSARQLD